MKINNILITGRLSRDIEQIVGINHNLEDKNLRYLSEDEVAKEDFLWADAFVSFRPTANFQFGNIKWVHSLGAGVDSFLEVEDWKKGVLLTRTICSFGRKIGEYCLSYILKDLQFHQKFHSLKTKKEWNPIAPIPLKNVKVIVFGTGTIGEEVAKMLAFLGVMVYGVSRSGVQKTPFEKVDTLEEVDQTFLKETDYVINTLPFTQETNQFFNKEFFDKLSGGTFINVGRGASVDYSSLLKALDNGCLKSAILDVFPEEPLPGSDSLWDHPNVIITPHISAITSPEEAVGCFMDTLHRIESRKSLSNLVDVEKGY